MPWQLMFPFKGFVDEYPYAPTGLTTARWNTEVPIQAVPLSNLILTQRGVYIEKLFRPLSEYKSPDTPKVVLWNGEYWLEDGHHRVVSAALQGHKSVWARVFIHPDLTAPTELAKM